MKKFIVKGKKPLSGSFQVAGNKNAALPALAVSLMTDQTVTLRNIPDILDVRVSLEILQSLGAEVDYHDHVVTINSAKVDRDQVPDELAARLRASILYLAPLLHRQGRVKLRHPGGCVIGKRPVGTHFRALEELGYQVSVKQDHYLVEHNSPVTDCEVFMDEVSVTATENLLMIAAGRPAVTRIVGAACEPHVVDVAHMLQQMGAKIDGIGSNVLTVSGTEDLSGVDFRIGPDIIEAGSVIILAAVSQSELVIDQIKADELRVIQHYLQAFGVRLEYLSDSQVKVLPAALHAPVGLKEIQSRFWPGLPSDLMSILIVLATQAQGNTLFHEWMYNSRLFFTDKLTRMGANIIMCDPHRVLVSGPTALRGKVLPSPDIRAGVAMLVAALIAEGESVIEHAEMILRGHERVDERFGQLGADITLIDG